MKKLLFLLVAFTATLSAQKKEITLEDIGSKGTFSTNQLNVFHSMRNGDFYTIQNLDWKTGTPSLDKYRFKR